MNNREIGAKYEKIAEEYLKKQGLKLLTKNYRIKYGEIDLIFLDKEYLVFCEVKYRQFSNFGSPLEAVNKKKVKNIRKVAEFYLIQHLYKENQKIRFDCVGILGNQITWIRDAF